MIHPVAWLGWVLAALAAISTTRNPLYLVLAILCIWLVNRMVGGVSPVRPFKLVSWKVVVGLVVISTVFNSLFAHFGETHLVQIPPSIPLLGGWVTLEAMVYGATNGLVIFAMLAVFAVLNQALPVQALIRLVPRAFYPLAVVTSIAVTFVPVTVRQFRQVYEAQMIRGHRLRRLQDWLPLLIPLLTGGLEHAVQLSEAMTARGFASLPARPLGGQRWLLVSGLLLAVAGWVVWVGKHQPAASLLLIACGSLLLGGGIWRAGRQVKRTIYQRYSWGWRSGMVIFSVIVLVSWVWLPWFHPLRQALVFNPYPALTWPAFDLLSGVITLILTLPAFLLHKSEA
jgi:energy-coupling factor transport system permease protein